MKKLHSAFARLFIALIFAFSAVASFAVPASAASCPTPSGTKPVFCYNGPQISGDGSSTLHTILQLLFGSLGAICVIVIIYAGLRLSLSRGNPDAIGKLRNTIIYAGVGLAVALGASAILQFVIKGVTN